MKWIILYKTKKGGDWTGEWWTFEGTEAEARHCATLNSEHLDYGRTGYRLVTDSPPAPETTPPR